MGVGAREKQFPQIGLAVIAGGLLEAHSGALMARRAVAAVVEDAVQHGVEYRNAQVLRPAGLGRVQHVATNHGENIAAGASLFSCGAWLGKVFPDVLSPPLFSTPPEMSLFFIPSPPSPLSPPPPPPFL